MKVKELAPKGTGPSGFRDYKMKFEDCIIIEKSRTGRVTISCVKGLWAVSGSDPKRVTREALNYWRQYELDGEYRAGKGTPI